MCYDVNRYDPFGCIFFVTFTPRIIVAGDKYQPFVLVYPGNLKAEIVNK